MCATRCWDTDHIPLYGRLAGTDDYHSCVACCTPKHGIKNINETNIQIYTHTFAAYDATTNRNKECTLLQCQTGWAHSRSWVLPPQEHGCRLFLGQGEQLPGWQGSWHGCWPQLKVRPHSWPHDQVLVEHRLVLGGCWPQWHELFTFFGQGGQGPRICSKIHQLNYSKTISIFISPWWDITLDQTILATWKDTNKLEYVII